MNPKTSDSRHQTSVIKQQTGTKHRTSSIGHRLLALFLTFTVLLPSITPYNNLWANNVSPDAPEAASFEPVDAPDMVNLLTGDMAYTIPIINIPGSNGGYPLALSYHAGIATDQESSWVGLGWSLNPGALNRNVKRYPDDWREAKTFDYYWDEGSTYRQHTIDIVIPLKALTIGLGFSWGNLRGTGGSVSLGIGAVNVSMGTDGVGVGVGIPKTPFQIGVHVNPMEDSYTFNAGLQTPGSGLGMKMGVSINNKSGATGYAALTYSVGNSQTKYSGQASVGLTTQGAFTYSMSASINTFYQKQNGDFWKDLSGRKIGSGSYSAGSGGSVFSTTLQDGDTSIKSSGYTIPLIVINYTYEKVKVWIDKNKQTLATGSLYEPITNVDDLVINYCETYAKRKTSFDCSINECTDIGEENIYNTYYNECTSNPAEYDFEHYAKVDSYFSDTFSFPEFDDYVFVGQGITGSATPKFNGIATLSKEYDSGLVVDSDYEQYDINDLVDRTKKVDFVFRNTLNHRSQINPVQFTENVNANNLEDFITNPSDVVTGTEKAGNFIEYFTFEEVESNPSVSMANGFVKPDLVEKEAIAGFKVTSTDGITYHYMLPVYNHLTKIRKNEDSDLRKKYSESTKPAYATHWLLTGVTGPDYYDKNGNNEFDEQDYGYWVNFDYGKWSSGMTWSNPSDLEKVFEDKKHSYMWGVKDLYYLDKVNTNTHTAFFIKDIREDAKGVPFKYIDKNSSYDKTLPSQKQLLLDKIVVMKNEDATSISKTNVSTLSSAYDFRFYDPRSANTHDFNLNLQNNVIDVNDSGINNTMIQNSVSSIDFEYDYSLCSGANNTDANGKLTLRKIYTKGNKGVSYMPPYEFNYDNNPEWSHDIENTWGYIHDNPEAWSLTNVKLPQGSEIDISYSPDIYVASGDSVGNITTLQVDFYPSESGFSASAQIFNFDYSVGDILDMSFIYIHASCPQLVPRVYCNPQSYDNNVYCTLTKQADFAGKVRISKITQDGDSRIATLIPQDLANDYKYEEGWTQSYGQCTAGQTEAYLRKAGGVKLKDRVAGIKTSSIEVSDGINQSWKTIYSYGIGNVSYETALEDVHLNKYYADRIFLKPNPVVIYPEVTVTKYNLENEKVLESTYSFFTNIDGGNVDQSHEDSSYFSIDDMLGVDSVVARSKTFKDYSSNVGMLKSVVHEESTKTIRETYNYDYLDENSDFVNKESYQSYFGDDPQYSGNYKELISTSIYHYPTILNRKQVDVSNERYNNTTVVETFEDMDPYTGANTTTITQKNDEPKIKSVVIPAWSKYPDMGSKKENSSYANMLEQTVANYVYQQNRETDVYELLSTQIQTWHDKWSYRNYKGQIENAPNNVWRKHKKYAWEGSSDGTGLNPNGTIADLVGATSFNWWHNSEPPSNSGWVRVSKVNMYNKYSAELESENRFGEKVATKFTYDDNKVIASSNTAYENFYFAGFEDYSYQPDGLSGEVNSGSINANVYHTGYKGLNISGSWNAIKNNDFKTDKYKVSFWVNGNNQFTVNGITADDKITAGNWTLHNFYVDLNNGTNVIIEGTGVIDDFRMCPAVSTTIKCFVYDEWDHMSYIINNNGFATKYIYNEIGHLKEVWQEVSDKPSLSGGFKKVAEHQLKYKNN